MITTLIVYLLIQTGLDSRDNSPWQHKKIRINSGIVEPAVEGNEITSVYMFDV